MLFVVCCLMIDICRLLCVVGWPVVVGRALLVVVCWWLLSVVCCLLCAVRYVFVCCSLCVVRCLLLVEC